MQNAQQYTSQLRQQQAALKSTQTARLCRRQVGSAEGATQQRAKASRRRSAQRDQAKLNLGYATVTAAQPGRVAQLTAAPGEFAQPGTRLTHVRAGRYLGDRQFQGDAARPYAPRARR